MAWGAPNSWFSQIVIYDSHYTGGGESEPVTDEQYNNLNAEEYTGRTITAGNPVMFQRAASASSNGHFSGPVYISNLLDEDNAAGAPSLHYVVLSRVSSTTGTPMRAGRSSLPRTA